MATFAIITLGCKVNTYESERYEEGMKALGYEVVDAKEVADIYIINTCAVTNTAASKSRQMIHRCKAQNPNAFIAVVGCYAQMESERVKEEGIDVMIGSSHKQELADLIHRAYTSKQSICLLDEIRSINVFESLPIHQFQHQTRAFLKVQDGCNQFCSYCIIPYTRGQERSLPLPQAIAIAKQLVKNGHEEIVLSGIHTGRYGREIGTDLCALLKEMCMIEGLKRIRISSIEMNEISDEMIDFMKDHDQIAKHLHIPIQSGSDGVLKRMGRPYRKEQFIKRIKEIRDKIPDISISTDLIVGFPQESEEEFLESYETCKTIGFSFMHVFPYSKRNGTKAAAMSGHLTNQLKKERAKKMIALSEQLYQDYKKKMIGNTVSVLFERVVDHQSIGHTSDYVPVHADGAWHGLMNGTVIDVLADGSLLVNV